MNNLKDIIVRLERQYKAIDRALSALEGLGDSGAMASASVSSVPAKRKRRLTPAGRRRISEALKRRWAAKRAAAAAPAAKKSAAKRKRAAAKASA
jgi:hypothetical protein